MSKNVNRVFSASGKVINTSLIRHIYLSEKYNLDYSDRVGDAWAMGHSVKTATQYYIKR